MDGETLNDLVRFIRIPAAALAITVNILIVIVIFRYSAMRSNASNLLIAQLAFADVLMGKMEEFQLTHLKMQIDDIF